MVAWISIILKKKIPWSCNLPYLNNVPFPIMSGICYIYYNKWHTSIIGGQRVNVWYVEQNIKILSWVFMTYVQMKDQSQSFLLPQDVDRNYTA